VQNLESALSESGWFFIDILLEVWLSKLGFLVKISSVIVSNISATPSPVLELTAKKGIPKLDARSCPEVKLCQRMGLACC
jgi:hypothetical protein